MTRLLTAIVILIVTGAYVFHAASRSAERLELVDAVGEAILRRLAFCERNHDHKGCLAWADALHKEHLSRRTKTEKPE